MSDLILSDFRDRLFLGHTDLLGLGGPTVDCATSEELFAVLQVGSLDEHVDGEVVIRLSNHHRDVFRPFDVSLRELQQTVDRIVKEESWATFTPQKGMIRDPIVSIVL